MLNAQNAEKQTPLFYSIGTSENFVFDYLLLCGAESSDCRYIEIASTFGTFNAHIFMTLVRKNISSVDTMAQTNKKLSVFCCMVKHNLLAEFKELVDAGCKSYNVMCTYGTPLSLAVRLKRLEFVEYLCGLLGDEACADLGHRTTLLHSAALLSTLEITKLIFPANQKFLDAKNHTKQEPIHAALHACRYDIAAFLLEKGATGSKRKGPNGAYPIHIACDDPLGTAFVKKLIEHEGRNKTLRVYTDMRTRNDLIQPIHVASHSGCLETVQLLLDAGVSPDGTLGFQHWSPIMHAMNMGYNEIVDLLMQHGADISSYFAGVCLADLAVERGSAEMLTKLFVRGVDFDCVDPNGFSIIQKTIHHQIKHNYYTEPINRLLIQMGSNRYIPDVLEAQAEDIKPELRFFLFSHFNSVFKQDIKWGFALSELPSNKHGEIRTVMTDDEEEQVHESRYLTFFQRSFTVRLLQELERDPRPFVTVSLSANRRVVRRCFPG